MTALASPPVPVAPSVQREFTEQELVRLADAGGSEWIDGRVVETLMGFDETWTATEVGFRLKLFVRDHPLGDVVIEQSFRCIPDDPTGFRRPEVAFVAAGRVPSPAPPGPVPVVPDLAVAVISPTDNVRELELKLADYRSAGVPLVWVLIPAVRTVRVFPLDGPDHALRVGDTLDGGAVLPGFAVGVVDLFRPAGAVAGR